MNDKLSNQPVVITSVVSVAGGALFLIIGAVVVAVPAVRFVQAGPAASFVVVGSYLVLVILAVLGVLAGVASWLHDRSLFTSLSVAMWSLTVVALFIEPVPVFSFAVLAALGTLSFRVAEASGATGLAFSFRRVEPTWIPPADYRPGHDLSRTRSGIIAEHQRRSGGLPEIEPPDQRRWRP